MKFHRLREAIAKAVRKGACDSDRNMSGSVGFCNHYYSISPRDWNAIQDAANDDTHDIPIGPDERLTIEHIKFLETTAPPPDPQKEREVRARTMEHAERHVLNNDI